MLAERFMAGLISTIWRRETLRDTRRAMRAKCPLHPSLKGDGPRRISDAAIGRDGESCL
jgi:hypothetical protein